jgi:hypothetical protein
MHRGAVSKSEVSAFENEQYASAIVAQACSEMKGRDLLQSLGIDRCSCLHQDAACFDESIECSEMQGRVIFAIPCID